MDEAIQTTNSFVVTEDVVIGERSSRISSAIVFLLMFVPVFGTVLFGAVDNITWIMISVMWLAIVALWAAETVKGRGLLLNTSALQLPLLGLMLIGVIQLLPLSSGDPAISGSVRSISMDQFATRFFLSHLAVYTVFFAACLTFINNEARLRRAVLLVIIFGAGMAFFGILQRLANPESIYGLRGTPQGVPFGPFINEHHFASFMEMTSGVALAFLFGKRTKRDKRILVGFAAVAMGMAVVFTSSRGGLLGLISVIAFVALLNLLSGRWSGEKRSESTSGMQGKLAVGAGAAALLLVILGLVLILGGNEQLARGIGATQVEGGVTNGRAHFWPIAVKIFLDHPFLGAGFDAFGVAFTKYDTWSGQLRVEQAHNDYLQTLADAGILGFACIVSFILLFFKKGIATLSSAHGFRRDAAIGAMAGCFGLMIHSFFDFPLRTPSNAFFFLLICAIAVVPIRSEHREHRRRKHRD
jgi:O-antigen ligase